MVEWLSKINEKTMNFFTSDDEKLVWKTGESKTLLKTVVCDITSQRSH